MKALLRSLQRHQVFTLSSGVILANVVSFVSMPILARLYPTESFGYYAIYLSASTIVGTFASCRLEGAIPVAESERDASGLAWMGFWLILLASCLCFVALSLLPLQLLFKAVPTGTGFAALTAISAIALGVTQVLVQVKVRRSGFRMLSLRHVVERLAVAGFGIALARLGFSSFGLIIAQTIGLWLSTILLLFNNGATLEVHGRSLFNGRARELIARYRDFPLQNLPSLMLTILNMQLPPLLLSIYFSASQVGELSIFQRLIDAPQSLVAGSMALIYYRRLLSLGREHRPRLYRLVLKLSILGFIVPGVLTMIFAKQITVILLGAKWADASIYLVALVPLGVVRLLFSLQQPIFIASRRLDRDLLVSGAVCVSNLAVIAIGITVSDHLFSIVLASAISTTFVFIYGVYLLGKTANFADPPVPLTAA